MDKQLIMRGWRVLKNDGMHAFIVKSQSILEDALSKYFYMYLAPDKSSGDFSAAEYYYFGHPKCATNWIRLFLYHFCVRSRMNYNVVGGNPKRNFRHPAYQSSFNLMVNASYNDLKNLPLDVYGFRFIRDPRDLVVSAYFSWKYSHGLGSGVNINAGAAFMKKNRDYLNAHSLEEGLEYVMQHYDTLQKMRGWDLEKYPNVKVLKFEDLIQDEIHGFQKLIVDLGIDVSDKMVQVCAEKSSFKRVSGVRKKGKENKKSHFRKGTAGDWKNYMPVGSALYDRFLELHGPLLEELGYDK